MQTNNQEVPKKREVQIFEEELSIWLAVLWWTKRKFLVSEPIGDGSPMSPMLRTLTYSSTNSEERMVKQMISELRKDRSQKLQGL